MWEVAEEEKAVRGTGMSVSKVGLGCELCQLCWSLTASLCKSTLGPTFCEFWNKRERDVSSRRLPEF
jgi:hypothetical protein